MTANMTLYSGFTLLTNYSFDGESFQVFLKFASSSEVVCMSIVYQCTYKQYSRILKTGTTTHNGPSSFGS